MFGFIYQGAGDIGLPLYIWVSDISDINSHYGCNECDHIVCDDDGDDDDDRAVMIVCWR